MLIEAVTSLLLIDTFRLWGRRSAYPLISLKNQESATKAEHGTKYQDFILLTAPNLSIPLSLLKQAVQWAEDEGLLVVDLTSTKAKSIDQLALLQQAHPIDYSQNPFDLGMTAGLAIIVHESVYQRVGQAPRELSEWLKYGKMLKKYAPWQTSMLMVNGWQQGSIFDWIDQQFPEKSLWIKRSVLSQLYGGQLNLAKLGLPVIWFAMGQSIAQSNVWGWSALVIWCLQPWLILGSNWSKDIWLASIFRPFLDIKNWLILWGASEEKTEVLTQKSLVDTYQSLLKDGTSRFFEPKSSTCVFCGSTNLKLHHRLKDQYQSKPGEFHLDRCVDCGHIFQNPRLSIEGLNFYYRDFYDGLGEHSMDRIFGASDQSYRQRIAMLRNYSHPKNWLDVGGGHGHFALIAKHLMPQTQFDVLDLSESVEIAFKRGWIHQGIRGLFPEMVASLQGKYDGISMSHYLEHTIDPKAEIKAASEVLAPGGALMIEVPDPESKMGQFLGSFWLPWFQPQHLNLLPSGNLQKLMEANGFEIKALDRAGAHQSVDLFFAVLIVLQRLAPDPNRPWQIKQASEPVKGLLSIWRGLVFLVGLPCLLIGFGLDWILRPFLAKPGYANTYRILGVKKGL